MRTALQKIGTACLGTVPWSLRACCRCASATLATSYALLANAPRCSSLIRGFEDDAGLDPLPVLDCVKTC